MNKPRLVRRVAFGLRDRAPWGVLVAAVPASHQGHDELAPGRNIEDLKCHRSISLKMPLTKL